MGNTVVNTNVMAINSHRNLKSVGNTQSKSSQRLSSGLRINSAADDAAGLAISEKMRAQIRGLDQASTNSQDGISLLQTAEGGMQEVDNMLQRVRELVVQAANDTNDYDSDDRKKIQDEINSLVEEIDSMRDRVEFNNKKIINGSSQNILAARAAVSVAIGDYGSVGSGTTTGKLGDAYTNNLSSISWGAITKAVTTATSGTGTDAVEVSVISGVTVASVAISQASLNAAISSSVTNMSALNSMVEAIDSALESIKGSSSTTFQAAYTELSNLKTGIMAYRKVLAGKLMLDAQAGALSVAKTDVSRDLYLQVGANANQSIKVSIGNVSSKMLNIGDGAGQTDLNVIERSGSKISAQLDTLDAAISYVSSQRSKLGAIQNRLEYTINSLDVSSENLTAAESRIRDTDMAKEMMNLTKSNVLSQAATSMLAQANQAPQNVLQLLQ